MVITRYNAKRGRIQIDGLLVRAGSDGFIMLTGGDQPHIGAVTVGQTGNFCQTISFCHHKEDQICRMLSDNLQKKPVINRFVLACGIHVDQITAEEIKEVVEMCENLFEEMQNDLSKEAAP